MDVIAEFRQRCLLLRDWIKQERGQFQLHFTPTNAITLERLLTEASLYETSEEFLTQQDELERVEALWTTLVTSGRAQEGSTLESLWIELALLWEGFNADRLKYKSDFEGALDAVRQRTGALLESTRRLTRWASDRSLDLSTLSLDSEQPDLDTEQFSARVSELLSERERSEASAERDALRSEADQLRRAYALSDDCCSALEALNSHWSRLENSEEVARKQMDDQSAKMNELLENVDEHVAWLETRKETFALRPFPDKLSLLNELLSELEKYSSDERPVRECEREALLREAEKGCDGGWLTAERASALKERLVAGWTELDQANETYDRELTRARLVCYEMQTASVEQGMCTLLRWAEKERGKMADVLRDLPTDKDAILTLLEADDHRCADMLRRAKNKSALESDYTILASKKASLVGAAADLAQAWPLLENEHEFYRSKLEYTLHGAAGNDNQHVAGEDANVDIASLQAQADALIAWCEGKRKEFVEIRRAFPQYLSTLEELADCFDRDYLRKERAPQQEAKDALLKTLAGLANSSGSGQVAQAILEQVNSNWQSLLEEHELYRPALDAAISARQEEVADEAETNKLLSWVWQQRAELSQQRSDLSRQTLDSLMRLAEENEPRIRGEEALAMQRRKRNLEERLSRRSTILSHACAENIRSAFWTLDSAMEDYSRALRLHIRKKESVEKSVEERAHGVKQWAEKQKLWLESKNIEELNRQELEQLSMEFHSFQEEWVERRQEKRAILALLLPEDTPTDSLTSPSDLASPVNERERVANQLQGSWTPVKRTLAVFTRQLSAALAAPPPPLEVKVETTVSDSQSNEQVQSSEREHQQEPTVKSSPVVQPADVKLVKVEQPVMEAWATMELDARLHSCPPVANTTDGEAPDLPAILEISDKTADVPDTVFSESAPSIMASATATASDTSSVGSIEMETDDDDALDAVQATGDRLKEHLDRRSKLLVWLRRQVALLQQKSFPQSLTALEQHRHHVGVFERGALAIKRAEKDALLNDATSLAEKLDQTSDEARVVTDGAEELRTMWEWLEKEKVLYKQVLQDLLQERVAPPPQHIPQLDDSYSKLNIRISKASMHGRTKVLRDTTEHVTIKDLICSIWFSFRDMVVPF